MNSANPSTNSSQRVTSTHLNQVNGGGKEREKNWKLNIAVRGREQYRATGGAYHQHRKREREVTERIEEIAMISLNIRGFNTEAKQEVIGNLIQREAPHLICLNETKLQIPLYLNNYWSHQTMLQRNGGSWVAASTKMRLTLVKALGTYLCWVRVQTGDCEVQLLNCYLEPGEQQFQKERAVRVTDIIKDILR